MNEFTTTAYGLFVAVNKVGGGTVGRDYGGVWKVTVKNGDVFVYDNSRLSTSTPRNHEEVAAMAADFASAEIDRNL